MYILILAFSGFPHRPVFCHLAKRVDDLLVVVLFNLILAQFSPGNGERKELPFGELARLCPKTFCKQDTGFIAKLIPINKSVQSIQFQITKSIRF